MLEWRTAASTRPPLAQPRTQLHDIFETRTQVQVVVELAEGGTLFDGVLRRPAWTEADVVAVVRQVSSALACMHKRGVAHGDLKPENLLFSQEGDHARLLVADFGLARTAEGSSWLSHTAIGAATYVAPEMIAGGAWGPAADMWALGVMAYMLLCGYPPFHDNNLFTLYGKVTGADVPFPEADWKDVSSGRQPSARGPPQSFPGGLDPRRVGRSSP